MLMEGDLKMFNKNEIKKELLKSRVDANFSYYSNGKLFYNVQLNEGLYQFPILTIEDGPTYNIDESGLSMYERNTIQLSSDLGTTNFDAVIKASYLNRWIDKAIDLEEFIKIG